ncbi:D-2-hydroxyacid dehydrogenase family protein [Streptomyces hoynatensis]|uniref:D-2-hydroxyacid dehydrogenase family protein n=1 Tax=Streptomyces hoynatensis TaxID=1141874 RepID=A0A3A9YPS4_9ACTN|nr:D-2-hydroxyacid dehydrogenase family protein [Streptomyces hoynatensis]RKN37197.1 D-2-hydroxyacid dehydrogenase family protein [Streptomyces hoynatensis]
MPAPRIAVLDDYQEAALGSADWSPLEGRADVTVFTDHLAEEDAVAERLAGFEVVIAMRERTPFPRSLLVRLPALRLLVTAGMVNAAIDVAAARELGVTVCGTRSGLAGTRELIWGLVLSLVRDIPAQDASIRSGGWQRGLGVELAGRTLGILGLGRLGSAVARYAHAFDMNVVAWSEHLTEAAAAEHGAELVSKRELFARSDIVSLHVRLSARSRGLVGAEELRLLGPRGYLVNTSRGPVVDEAALVAALREGTIAGAALDVYDREPLPADHPLRSAPRTVLTPHIGYVTREGLSVIYGEAVEAIVAWLDGAPVRELTA